MKNVKISKRSNARDLHDELVAAGYKIHGVSAMGPTTIVHLEDTETKDPKTIVDTHLYTAPEKRKERVTREKAEFASLDVAGKISRLAKRAGFE